MDPDAHDALMCNLRTCFVTNPQDPEESTKRHFAIMMKAVHVVPLITESCHLIRQLSPESRIIVISWNLRLVGDRRVVAVRPDDDLRMFEGDVLIIEDAAHTSEAVVAYSLAGMSNVLGNQWRCVIALAHAPCSFTGRNGTPCTVNLNTQ